MSRRCCAHCYKTTDDEDHDWFCIYGSGIAPHEQKVKGSDVNDRPSGGGGGGSRGNDDDGGEPRIIPPPFTPRPGGAAIKLPKPPQKDIHVGELQKLDKPHLVEHKPQLALPAPDKVRHDDLASPSERSARKRGSQG